MHFADEHFLSIFDAADEVSNMLKADLVPFLHGSPAIGKSSVAKAVADMFNLKLLDIRVVSLDQCDFNGLPDLSGNRAVFKQFTTFPLEGDELPIKVPATENTPAVYYDGWLILLDEFSSADEDRQVAAYKLVLDRMVGDRKLHSKVRIMAAGNLETDGAIVNQMSSALVSRFAHMPVKHDMKRWITEIAYKHKMDTRIAMFLEFRPNCFYTFDPAKPDAIYASPRTWWDANKYLQVLKPQTAKKGTEIESFARRRVFGGIVGPGVADEFHAFLKYQDQLPTRKQVMEQPDAFPLDTDNIGLIYALAGMLADMFDRETEENVIKVANRLPRDFTVVTLRAVVKQHGSEILSYPHMSKWLTNNADLVS